MAKVFRTLDINLNGAIGVAEIICLKVHGTCMCMAWHTHSMAYAWTWLAHAWHMRYALRQRVLTTDSLTHSLTHLLTYQGRARRGSTLLYTRGHGTLPCRRGECRAQAEASAPSTPSHHAASPSLHPRTPSPRSACTCTVCTCPACCATISSSRCSARSGSSRSSRTTPWTWSPTGWRTWLRRRRR